MLMSSLMPWLRFHGPHGEQFEQVREDILAVAAGERKRHLRCEESIADADVVAAAGFFEGEILLAFGQFVEHGGQ